MRGQHPARGGGAWASRHGHGERRRSRLRQRLVRCADGALYVSILDLARWDAALYGDKLLPQRQLEKLWRIAPLNDGRPNPGHYGYGWFIEKRNGHSVVEHQGGWQGFSTYIGRYRQDRLTVVVLTNFADADANAIADAVAALYLAGPAH